MRTSTRVRALLLLLVGAAVANAGTVSKTNRDPENLPWARMVDGQKPKDGFYEPWGQAPIAVAHTLQLPCGNKFLMMEFGPTGKEGKLMLPHPASNDKGRNILQVYDRDADTWTDVPTNVNSVCGGWARLANGQVGLFAGHYATLDVYQVDGMKAIKVFDPSTYGLTTRSNLTAKRWYPSTITLANGDIYIPGGTWHQRPPGIWPKAEGADIYTHAYDKVTRVKTNPELHNAGLGNWYIGALVLPSGQVLMSNARMLQVVNPYTGDAYAQAPPLPAPVKDMTWEFPRMGPQVHLRMPVLKKDKSVRVEFMAFGGGWVDQTLKKTMEATPHTGPNRNESEWKECVDKSVRIGLTIHPDGRHVFDDNWVVEQMPGPRCIFDGVLLPNGHIVLLGGQKMGLGDLTDGGPTPKGKYNGGQEPYNEAWIYRPDKPEGERFKVTAAKTRLARMYHATSILTAKGDIIVGGTSNAAFWQSSHEEDFSRTPLGVNEYRMEIYHPPYEFRPNKPRFTMRPPTFVTYGSTFDIGYAFDEAADVAGVVLVNAGGVTHNLAIGARSQLLGFKVAEKNATHGVLRIEAPPAPEFAPPSHYMLFLLRGETYSEAEWVQIRKAPRKQVPVDFPQESKFVAEFSSNFEEGKEQPFYLVRNDGRLAAGNLKAEFSKGTGSRGGRVALLGGSNVGQAGSVLLRSAPKQLQAGSICNAQFWARAGRNNPISAQMVRMDSSWSPPIETYRMEAGSLAGPVVVASSKMPLKASHYCLHVFGPITIQQGGQHVLQFDLGETEAGATFDFDDIEVYCTNV